MGTHDLLHSISERLESTANVKKVFGDPVTADGKTIIPVARIGYGFGAGTGRRADKDKEGGGGGGGVGARPVGVIEITPQATRFVPVSVNRKLAAAAAAGFLLGALWARRRR